MKKNGCHSHSSVDITVPEVDAFLTSLRRKKYSKKSITSYKNALKKLFSFLAGRACERVQDIGREDLEAYRLDLVKRSFKANTIDLYLRSARNFFAYLEEAQKIFVNPAKGLLCPRPPRPLQPVPTEAEVKKLLAQPDITRPCGLRDRALLEVTYSTGIRLQELHKLTIFDPDLDRGTLRVLGKGRKERIVPLGKIALQWLKRYLRDVRPQLLKEKLDEEALWLRRDGAPLGYGRIQQLIGRYARRAGIKTPISAHGLRRACATHMLRRGAHPLQLQMLLGHASLKMLSQYLRVTITDLKNTHQRTKPGR